MTSFLQEAFSSASVQDAWADAQNLLFSASDAAAAADTAAAAAAAAADAAEGPRVVIHEHQNVYVNPLPMFFAPPAPAPAPVVIINNNTASGTTTTTTTTRRRRARANGAQEEEDEDEDDESRRKKKDSEQFTLGQLLSVGAMVVAAAAAAYVTTRAVEGERKARKRHEVAQAALAHVQESLRKYSLDPVAQTQCRHLRTVFENLAAIDGESDGSLADSRILPWALVATGAVAGATNVLLTGTLQRSALGYATVVLPSVGLIWMAVRAARHADDPSRDERLQAMRIATQQLHPFLYAPTAPAAADTYDGAPPEYHEPHFL